MFIRKAFTVFLELWSTADQPSDWIVDWRWFTEEAEAGVEMFHAATRHRDLCVTTSLQVNAPS